MAVTREFNWQGQQRVDLPHLRAVESAVRYDLDSIGYCLVGTTTPQILKGFELVTTIKAVDLGLKVAGAKVIHPLATDAGSFFSVSDTQPIESLNPNISINMVGSWIPGQNNYVGVDFVKSADTSVTDLVAFSDPNTQEEQTYKVPIARTAQYKIHISSVDHSYNRTFLPLYTIAVDGVGNVSSVIDVRPLFGRLTPGGTVSGDVVPYGWPGGRPSVESSSNLVAGDKSIASVKDLVRAIQTRVWEIGGGPYWYSPTADRNVRMIMGSTTFTSTGEAFEVATGHLHWKGLSFIFDNSPKYFCTIADQLGNQTGLTDLADGECVYCDIDRNTTSNITLQKGVLLTLGMSSRPGQRFVVCWRIGNNYYVRDQSWPVGGSFGKISTTLVAGLIKTTINANGSDLTAPIAASIANSAQGGQTATCGGVSRNIGLTPSTTNLLPAGPLWIGGNVGDQDIAIQPAAGYKTVLAAETNVDAAVTMSQCSLSTPDTTKIAKFGTLLVGDIPTRSTGVVNDDSTAVVAIDANGAIGLANTDSVWDPAFGYPSIPSTPSVDNFGLIRSKSFVRSDKVWMEPVSAIFTSTYLLGAWTNTSPGVWTQTGTAALNPGQFGGVTPTLNMRVLVLSSDATVEPSPVPSDPYQWIYTITNLGGGGNSAVLTRASDANTSKKVFKGCSVYLNATVGPLADNYFTIASPSPLTLETTPMIISLTSPETRDEFCIMWHDGTYTTIAQGPFYTYILPS